ncbi:SusC/RagA family TonB-linked outer membrane protein [Marinifilum caeruleilacunae]|uniref:SusC/RagA family TonB-linked outer membrane protein n=1 Tax=Marinifilum caeruleilacunae TaxID=2499076 RepID=A0ABX1X077_9BACT|nr:SusC/RagA family TonB-linked outer membrane protein [Marinifilum caeruleilacunae]NOU61762.1 SusC/RagA family TonB-linked outer membrane protein [Marinifilum caeruleilacunae]
MQGNLYPTYILLFIFGWLLSSTANAQTKPINGRVLSAEGKYVQGAMVTLIGSQQSVETGANGVFTLEVDPEDTLIKVEKGLVSEVFNLQKDDLDYVLDRYHGEIDLGMVSNRHPDEITGAVSTTYSNALNKASVINPENSLYGQLSGLTVLQNGGTPWSRNPDLMIRGVSSLNDNNVLVIIDGVVRSLSSISMDQIESISVLKDASSLAIYGQRGANGVIVVTTKRGEYESFEVEASYQYGVNTAFRMPDMLNAYEYALAVNQASILDGNSDIYSAEDLADFKNGTNPYFNPDVNWMDETMKDYGVSTNFNAQFKGGGKRLKYFTSLNYQTETGLFDQTDLDSRYDSKLKYTRFTVRSNIDADITPNTLVSINAQVALNDRKSPNTSVGSIMNSIYNTPAAAYPVRTMNGKWGGTAHYNDNPVARIASTGYREDFVRKFMGDLTIKQDMDKLVEGLSAELMVAYDNSAIFYEGKSKSYEYESVSAVRDENGVYGEPTSVLYGAESDLEDVDGNHYWLDQSRRATFRAKLNYEKNWGSSQLATSLLYSQDKVVNDGQYNTYLHQDVALTAHYGYKGKYFADLTVGYGGSSLLEDGNRFGVFPALSGAWIVSREDFLKKSSLIDLFKLRASWGMTGNDAVSANLEDQKFSKKGTYYFTNNFADYSGYTAGRLASSDLTYETAFMTNIGFDFRFFKKLDVTLDGFYEKRKDILVDSEGIVSDVIGITSDYTNDGEVKNKGFEVDLLWQDNLGSFNYYVGGSFSYAKNEIINQNEVYRPYSYQNRTGRAIGQQFGLEATGFFQDQADINNSPQQLFSDVRPGDVKYKDQNNDGVIDAYDEVAIGKSYVNPEIYYSLKLGFEIKGFGVDALFQGIANQTQFLNTSSVYWPLRNNTNISTFSANSWTPDTKSTATLPRLSMEDNDNNYRKNSIWLKDGDYLKLRTLDVYYNLPEKLVSKFKLSKAKVFLQGMNLFSIDDFDDVDPESHGISYPTLASYHIGVNIGF